MSHPWLQRTKFDHGAQYWEVTRPTAIHILKLVDGLEAVYEIKALLSAPHGLLALAAKFVS
jgi:hypothetical protein